MRKVVINACYGGFSLSAKAYKELGLEWDGYGFKYDDHRDDPELIRVVEKLGQESWGTVAELTVVEIPDDVNWAIEEYDGYEHVAEVHRTWS